MNKYITTISMFAIALMLFGIPASATHAVVIPIEFNTASNEEFTAAVLGEGNCVSLSGGGVADCAYGIGFNSSAGDNGNSYWVNASGQGAATSQDPDTADQAIIIITNTGTATLNLVMNASRRANEVDSCINLTFTHEQEATCTTTAVPDLTGNGVIGELGITETTLDASFLPADAQICVWLWGNFSACGAGLDGLDLYLNSTVV